MPKKGALVQVGPPIRYLFQETAISMAINGAISAGIFLALFGGQDRVPVWGVGNFVFDFLPQGFMVAMMGSLIPGALARRKWRADIPTIATPMRILLWAFQSAVLAALLGTALVGAGMWLAGFDTLPFAIGMTSKIVYGAALALLVTPMILQRVWFAPALPVKACP